LHIMSYQGEGAVVVLARDPEARAIIRHPRMIEVVAHLDEILEEADGE